MSDSFSSDESTPQRIVAVPPNGPPTALRWFFVVNGLVCCLLIGAWVAFGMRGRGESNDGDSKPFARATPRIAERQRVDANARDLRQHDLARLNLVDLMRGAFIEHDRAKRFATIGAH